MSRWPTHTPFFPIQCWKARFVRTPCELALLRFVDNIEWVGVGGRLKYVFLPQQYDNDCNHCHKSLAHTHPFPHSMLESTIYPNSLRIGAFTVCSQH